MTVLKQFRIEIFEEPEIILKICNALNALTNPTEKNGFKLSTSGQRFIISVYRCRNSYAAFEVSFKLRSALYDSLLINCINSMFRKCILSFSYDSSTGKLVVSIEDAYTEISLTENNECELECERTSCVLPLRKPFPELYIIIDIFNSVKMHIVYSDDNSDLAFFCSKFNYLSAQGIASFKFNVMTLGPTAPELLEITIIPPSDKEQKSKYDATMELISSISQFNS